MIYGRQPVRAVPRLVGPRRKPSPLSYRIGVSAAIGLLYPSGCLPAPTFDCGSDEQCNDLGQAARCEPAGYCSVADNRCTSGRRYHEYAGDGLASQCTRLRCGNGAVDPDEECDDANDADGDGCNRDCRRSGQEIWTRSYASTGNIEDRCYAVAIDSQGNAAVIGHIYTEGQGFDLWVRKYTVDGDAAWTWVKNGDANLDEEGWSIQVDGEDGFVVGGYLTTAAQGPNAWIARINADGFRVWEQQYDGGVARVDQARGVTIMPDGDISIAGYTTADDLWDTQLWLQRVSSDGSIVRWARVLPGFTDVSQPDRAHGIAHLDGDILAVGHRQDVGGVTHHFIARVNPQGSDVWREDGPDADGWPSSITAVEVTPKGELLIMGRKVNPAGNGDIWMQRRTGDAEVMWEEIVASPGESDDRGNGIAPTPDGGFIATGELGAGAGSTDGWIRRYDAQNREVWTDIVSGPAGGRDTIWDAEIDPQGNVIACGYTATPETGGGIWVRKYTP